LPLRELADDLPGLRIGLGRNGARIDHAQIGRLVLERLAVAVSFERLFDELSLVLIDLAAHGH